MTRKEVRVLRDMLTCLKNINTVLEHRFELLEAHLGITLVQMGKRALEDGTAYRKIEKKRV